MADKQTVDDALDEILDPIHCWRPISTNDRGWRWLSLVWKRKCQPYDFLYDQKPFYQYRVSTPQSKLQKEGE